MKSKQNFLVGKQQKPPGDFYEIIFGDLLDQRAQHQVRGRGCGAY